MNRAIYILSVCWLLLWQQSLHAQSEPESGAGSIELQSTSGKQSVTIPVHAKIGVKYTVGPRRYHRQTLDEVSDTSVVISDVKVGVQYLDEITVRDEDRYRDGRSIFWISIGIFLGFLVSVAILAAMALTSSAAIVAMAIFVTLLGIAAAIAMPGGVIVGIVLMAVAARTYRLHKDWKLVTHPPTDE